MHAIIKEGVALSIPCKTEIKAVITAAKGAMTATAVGERRRFASLRRSQQMPTVKRPKTIAKIKAIGEKENMKRSIGEPPTRMKCMAAASVTEVRKYVHICKVIKSIISMSFVKSEVQTMPRPSRIPAAAQSASPTFKESCIPPPLASKKQPTRQIKLARICTTVGFFRNTKNRIKGTAAQERCSRKA